MISLSLHSTGEDRKIKWDNLFQDSRHKKKYDRIYIMRIHFFYRIYRKKERVGTRIKLLKGRQKRSRQFCDF